MNKWWFLILIVVFSCKDRENTVEKLPFPIIVDTLGIEVNLLYGESKFPDYLSIANYPPFYIGSFRDSIYLCESIGLLPPPPEEDVAGEWKPPCGYLYRDYYKYWELDDFSNYRDKDEAFLSVYVDTSDLVADSYPTIIKNIGVDTALVGNMDFVSLIMEALDKENKWQPIQKDFMFSCGNGVESLILPPDNIIFTVTPKFSGIYYTKLRLKLGKSYSNEFNGWINPGQFKSRY